MGFPIGGIPWSWGKSPIREAYCRLAVFILGGEFDEVLEFYPCGLRLSGLRVFFSNFSKNMGSSVF